MKTTNPPGTRKAIVRSATLEGSIDPFEALVPETCVAGDLTREIQPNRATYGPTVRVVELIDEEARAAERLAVLERVAVAARLSDKAHYRDEANYAAAAIHSTLHELDALDDGAGAPKCGTCSGLGTIDQLRGSWGIAVIPCPECKEEEAG